MTSPEKEKSEQAALEYFIEPVQIMNRPGYRIVKRLFDVTVALAAGIVLLLPMLVVGVLIRLETPGPAIFKQLRMGRDGKPFTIYKFRTMRMDAPSDMATRELENSDAYITVLGAWLRRTSIDELPQLLNIIRGDMSFVGYRPVCLSEKELNQLRQQYGVFAVRPGLTGYAQVCGRDNVDYKQKVALDVEYLRRCGIRLDLWCLIRTAGVVFSGEGVK